MKINKHWNICKNTALIGLMLILMYIMGYVNGATDAMNTQPAPQQQGQFLKVGIVSDLHRKFNRDGR